jgi:hypothetical protein
MKPTTNSDLACLIFGHNFYKPKSFNKHSSKLVCKNCNTEVFTDQYGNFDASGSQDKTFEKTLKRLFLLRRQLAS